MDDVIVCVTLRDVTKTLRDVTHTMMSTKPPDPQRYSGLAYYDVMQRLT